MEGREGQISTASSTTTKLSLFTRTTEELSLREKAKHIAFRQALQQCAQYAAQEEGEENKTPVCFISYAWGVKAHEQWVEKFVEDLEHAGLKILLDKWEDRKGHELTAFVEKILDEKTSFIIVVGTKLYLEKFVHCGSMI